MISFDALPVANLVQILVDVLHDFGALSQVNYFSIDECNCFFFLPVFCKCRKKKIYGWNWCAMTIYGKAVQVNGVVMVGGSSGGVANSVKCRTNVKMILMRYKLIINWKVMEKMK